MDELRDLPLSVAADGTCDAGSVYEAVQGKGDGHRFEIRLACKILNTMTGFGMPDGV